MLDLCVSIKVVISDVNHEIVGSHAFWALLLCMVPWHIPPDNIPTGQ